ncbi:MAG: hypothetical protein HY775_08240 [Acidobacteria bacterium]|nr:hypothetical protein [Acidobacteriota bacterium]
MASRVALFASLAGAGLLAACGGGGNGETGSPPTAPAGSARTVSGRINYSGTALGSHKIVVVLNRQGDAGPPAYSAVLSRPGEYAIGDVADGSYTVLAFIDLGDDMGAPQADEPTGVYDPGGDGTPDVVIVRDGGPASGIDVAIKDPSR